MNNMRVLKSLTLAVIITITQTGCLSHSNLVVENPCAGGKAHEAVTPVPRERATWMVRHNAVVERIKQGKADVIFVGMGVGICARTKRQWAHLSMAVLPPMSL